MAIKIGVSYNCFSATELLPYSVQQIRHYVDYIVCVVQSTSYQGKEFYKDNKRIIEDLHRDGWVDEIVYYDNTRQHPKQNECNKRNLGKMILKENGCTHFLTMDEDELYHSREFKNAIDYVIDNGFDSSACQMQTYYKLSNCRVTPPETYYVPFLYRLDNRHFNIGQKYPVLADPSRKLATSNHHNFTRDKLEMHHYSYVRKDIRRKLFNSASAGNYGKRLEDIAVHWEKWEYPQQAYLGGSQKRLMNVELVKNPFEIDF